MDKLRWPYNLAYVPTIEIVKLSEQDLVTKMRNIRFDKVYINSVFVRTKISQKARTAAVLAGKKISFVSFMQMQDNSKNKRTKRH